MAASLVLASVLGSALSSFITFVDSLYNSVEGYRSNPVLAVKRSLFVEIRFLRSIFFETPCKILALGFYATLDRPVACQMVKLEQIKA